MHDLASLSLSGVDHIGIAVTDLERSLRFYTELLGMERVAHPGHPMTLRAGGVTLVLVHHPAPLPERLQGEHLAFLVAPGADLEAWEQRLEERGVRCARVHDRLYLHDPDERTLELIASPALSAG